MSDTRSCGKKKIVVLNASPNNDKSSTMSVTRAFVQGITSATECEVEYIDLSDLKIKPCLGCLSCWGRTEGECVIKDDDIPMMKEKIENADVFIESFPLFFFGMPGPLKTFTDRMLSMLCTYKGQQPPGDGKSFHGIRNPKKDRRFIIISSCAYDRAESVYDPLLSQFDCICGRKNYLPILCPQLYTLHKLDSESRKARYLKKFTEAGKLFAAEGTLSAETLKNLAKPPFSEETYKVLINQFWDSQKK